MYHPTTRVLAVLELLQTHPQLTGREIANRLEVDIRTARRYIEILQDLGVPIQAQYGRYGAYQLHSEYKLPPLMFSDQEALTVTLGLIAARSLNFAPNILAIEATLAKIERVLPQHIREQIIAVEKTLVIDTGRRTRTPPNEFLTDLSQAITLGHQVRLWYSSRNNIETERTFDPYGVVYHDGYWYVPGYCHKRNALRLFRLDRINKLELSETSFDQPADFDAFAFLCQTIALGSARWRVEVCLDTTLEIAQQVMPPTLAVLEETAQGVILRSYVQDLDWMALALVRLGVPFSVIRPQELCDFVRQLGRQIMLYAGNDTN